MQKAGGGKKNSDDTRKLHFLNSTETWCCKHTHQLLHGGRTFRSQPKGSSASPQLNPRCRPGPSRPLADHIYTKQLNIPSTLCTDKLHFITVCLILYDPFPEAGVAVLTEENRPIGHVNGLICHYMLTKSSKGTTLIKSDLCLFVLCNKILDYNL